jgi:hypothetical protein
MKGFENWREEEQQRQANAKAMRSYGGSPSYQAFQRRKHMEKLLEMAPTLSEARVVELMTSPDFKELPAEVQQALTDRMLELQRL